MTERDDTQAACEQILGSQNSALISSVLDARDAATTMSQSDLMQFLKNVDIDISGMREQATDATYNIVSYDTWATINQLMFQNKFQYVSNFRDCDAYAESFAGDVQVLFAINSVGYVIDYSGSHSYNVVVTYKSDPNGLYLQLIEPQTCQFVDPGPIQTNNPGQGYLLKFGIIDW